MKTNLDSLFKTDENLEKSGIWFELSETVGFLIKRFGGLNSPKVKMEMAKFYKPYARQIESGTMDPVKEKEIMLKVFVNACVLDWKGIEIDGAITPYSADACVKLLSGLPDLAETLISYSSDSKNYREDVGNC
jgi:hypothetical protein